MNSRLAKSRWAAAAAAVALSTLGAQAQTAPLPGNRVNQSQNAHGSPSAPETEGRLTTQTISGGSPFVIRQSPEQLLGASIMQQPVYMADGRGIGEIDDLLIDRGGRIVAVIIDVGGFLGITGRRVAVPMGSLEFQKPTTPGAEPTSLKVVFRTDRAAIEQAPPFESLAGRVQGRTQGSR